MSDIDILPPHIRKAENFEPDDLLVTVKAALAKSTPGPWALDERFGLDVVHADDVGQPHGGGATPELDARYCWVIANVRADKPFDGCEQFTRRKFVGQAQPLADAHLIANAPAWLRALATRCERAEADLTALRERFRDMEAKRNALFEEATALRQRHAEAVEAAYRAGFSDRKNYCYPESQPGEADAAWLASEAKARLT